MQGSILILLLDGYFLNPIEFPTHLEYLLRKIRTWKRRRRRRRESPFLRRTRRPRSPGTTRTWQSSAEGTPRRLRRPGSAGRATSSGCCFLLRRRRGCGPWRRWPPRRRPRRCPSCRCPSVSSPWEVIQEKHFGLSFGLKNGLRFHFDSETCLNYLF